MIRKGECNHCGWCCKAIGITNVDLAHSRESDPEYARVRGYGDGPKRLSIIDPCPMLKDDRCSIYSERPQTCRDWPTSPEDIEGTPCSYYFE